MNSPDDIVICGMSGRLPESDNLEEFWQNLVSGVDMVTENNLRWPAGKNSLIKKKCFICINLKELRPIQR